ncbi:50S ribosomal protein L29 [Candidatus Curtissbacteria bacterium]|nr:50S ribosomal protein L29 [Candidatus Curtissbacteria bacterium]
MKKKELDETKTKSLSELKKQLKELEKEKVKSQLELAMGKLKNVHLPGQKKRDIAKLRTIIKLKELARGSTVQKEDENAAG